MDLIENNEMVQLARTIAPEIAAASSRIEKARCIPEDIVDLLERNDFYRLLVPKSLGGLEVHPLVFFEVVKTFAKANASLGWAFQMTLDCSMTAPYMDSETAHEIFGGKSGRLVYGPPTPTASVERVEGGYKLSGKWGFASGSAEAPWFGAHVLVNEGDRNVTRTFVFPREAVKIMRGDWQEKEVLGLGSTSSNGYSVDDLFVAERFVFERDRAGEWKKEHPLYAFTSFEMSEYGAAAVAAGIIEAMLEGIQIEAERKRHGAGESIRDDKYVQTVLGECLATFGAYCSYIRTSIEDSMDSARRHGRLLGKNNARNRLATTGLINHSLDIADILFRFPGSRSVFEENPIAGQLRHIKVVGQQNQGSKEHFARAGRAFLHRHDDAQLEALARPPAIRSTPNPAVGAG